MAGADHSAATEVRAPEPVAETGRRIGTDRSGLLMLSAAFAAAPICWLLWSFVRPAAVDLAWPWVRPLAFLLVALVYPVAEEVCFRGWLQTGLRRLAWGRRGIAGISAANACTALAFAGLHGLTRGPVAAAAVFLPGLIFGFFRDRFDSLAAPVALHVVYNTGWFWLFGMV